MFLMTVKNVKKTYFVLFRIGHVHLPGVGDGPEDGEVLGEVVKVNSLRQYRIQASVFVVSGRKEGSDNPFSDRIKMDLKRIQSD